MKTKLACLLLFLGTISCSLNAQISARVYANALILNALPSPKPYGYDRQILDYNNLTYGFRWDKGDRKFNQIDVRFRVYEEEVEINHKDPNTQVTTIREFRVNATEIQAGFILGKYLYAEPESPWQFNLGLNPGLFALTEETQSLNTAVYPQDLYTYGLKVGLIGGVEYELLKWLKVEAAVAPFYVSFAITRITSNNPFLPEAQQTSTVFEFNGYSERFIRLGLAFQLGD